MRNWNPEMIRAFEDDYGIEVRHAWGMTEMSPIGSAGALKPAQAGLSHQEKLAIQAKQGWAPFGVEMKIVDDEDTELPWDGKRFGRLKVRGPMLMHGYANPEFSPGDGLCDGWFVTNDLAEISPSGELTILGRADGTIVSGGKKIHPATIEFLLAQCPGVETVVVAGRPDPVWGEIVTAVFSGPASGEDLLAWCREHVASPFRPRAAVRLETPPLLANGKPDRLKLRELATRGQPETGQVR